MSVARGEVFGLSVSPLELVARGSVMFLFLWGLFRVVIKRRIGAPLQDVADVDKAFLEPDGHITIVKVPDGPRNN